MLPGLSGIIGGTVGGAEIFVSYASATNTGSVTLTINKPTGTTSGDVLLFVGTCSSDSATFTGDTGWTEIYDSGTTPSFRLARLTAGGSEPASYAFTCSSISGKVGQIICLRNVQFDVAGAAMTTLTGDGNLAIGGITLVGGLLIAAVVTNQTATDIAHSTPSGMVKIANTTIPFALQPAITTFFQSMPSGATGTRTTAITNGTVENAGILIGFKP